MSRKRLIEFSGADLRAAIGQSLSWAETLRRLGYCPTGGNPGTVKRYARRWSIDTSHFDPEAGRLRSRQAVGRPLQEILVRRSSYSRGSLKRRLYREGFKDRRCELCGQGEIWRGRRMSLILDHINGERDDHRLENLRIVCPNCAATLATHCGRGSRKPRPPRRCEGCDTRFVPKFRQQKFCSRECGQRAGRVSGRGFARVDLRRVERPPYAELLDQIAASGYSAVGRRHGVSDNAVRKWVRQYERERERIEEERARRADRNGSSGAG